MKFLISIFILASFYYIDADLFSSNARLQSLVKAEGKLLIGLKEYIKAEENRLKILRSHIDDMKKKGFAEKFKGDALKFVGHPVNAFHVVRHFTKFWDTISKDSTKPANSYILENSWVWANLAEQSERPTVDDHYGAARAILRLQNVYNISMDELVEGRIFGRKVRGLNALDCFEIGISGFQVSKYEQSIAWLKKTIEVAKENDEELPKDTRRYIAKAYFMMGMNEDAHREAEIAYQEDSININVYRELMEYKEELGKARIDTIKYKSFIEMFNSTQKSLYNEYCRKKRAVDPKFASKLICRYRVSKLNPLERFKIELKSFDPWIAVIHDIISDAESEKIIKLSRPYLKRSKVGGASGSLISEVRVSQLAWLFDSLDPFVLKISDRLTAVTGLDAHNGAEALQVANYGLGGQYELHEDAFGGNQIYYGDLPGDRIYTLMIYLSHVEKGGNTVFPVSKVSVEPIKNAAAVWFNLDKSGGIDNRLLHGGCPVIYGSKWVANKWFRLGGQEFKYPCGLKPDELHETPH